MIDSNGKVEQIINYSEDYGEIWSFSFIEHDLYIDTRIGQTTGNLLLFHLGTVNLVSTWNKDNGIIYGLVVKDKKMYIGSKTNLNRSRLFKFDYSDGTITESTGWNKVTNYGEIWSFAFIEDDLYIGTRIEIINDKMFRGKLYKSSNNGNSFAEVSGWFKEYGAVTCLLNVNHGLYIGNKNYDDNKSKKFEGKLFFKKLK